MLSEFRSTMSIRNLYTCKKTSAQVATLFMLAMVGMLIFIMATVHLGQASLSATRVANAADSGALLLASQLSSKANSLLNMLKDNNGKGGLTYRDGPPPTLCSKGRSLLGLIIALLVLLALVIFCPACIAAVGAFLAHAFGIGAATTAVGATATVATTGTVTAVSGATATVVTATGVTVTGTVAAGTTAVVGATATVVTTGTVTAVSGAVAATGTVVAVSGSTATVVTAAGATVTGTVAAGTTAVVGATATVATTAGTTIATVATTAGTVATGTVVSTTTIGSVASFAGTIGSAAIGTGAGAVGGAIGTGSLKGTVMGALQGLSVGLSISGGMKLFAGLSSKATVAAAEGTHLAPGQALEKGSVFVSQTGEKITITGGMHATVAPSSLGGATVGPTGVNACVSIGDKIMYGTLQSANIIGKGFAAAAAAVGQPVSVISGLSGPVSGTLVEGAAISPGVAAGMGAGLLTASDLYSGISEAQMAGANFNAAVRQLNGMPEYDQIREAVFLNILGQLVDDPNKMTDYLDIDSDGSTKDQVTEFEMWWWWRSQIIKWLGGVIWGITGDFLSDNLTDFLSFVSGMIPNVSSTIPAGFFTPTNTNPNPQDLERNLFPNGQDTSMQGFFNRGGTRPGEDNMEGNDGIFLQLVRPADDAGKHFTWWHPGPTKAALDAWITLDGLVTGDDTPCPTCESEIDDPITIPPLPGYDEVDATITTLQNFIQQAQEYGFANNGFMGAGGQRLNFSWDLARTWQSWLPEFYDPDSNEDYYDQLGVLVEGRDADGDGLYTGPNDFKGMKRWRQEIIDWRKTLFECKYGCTKEKTLPGPPPITICLEYGYKNPPCKISWPITVGYKPNYKYAGSIDKDLDDEFTPVLGVNDDDLSQGLLKIIDKIGEEKPDGTVSGFRGDCKNLHDIIKYTYSAPYILAHVGEWLARNFSGAVLPEGFLDNAFLEGLDAYSYVWNDSRGHHQVRAETGPFKVPRVKKTTKGSLVGPGGQRMCMELKDYEDAEFSPNPLSPAITKYTWVDVTQRTMRILPKGAKASWIDLVAGYGKYVVVDPGTTPLRNGQELTKEEYDKALTQYGPNFRVAVGARSIERKSYAGFKFIKMTPLSQIILLGILRTKR